MALRAGHAFSKAFRSAAGLLALTLLASAELINFGPTPVKLVHDPSLKVEVVTTGLNAVQKFYFVPDPDNTLNPRVVATNPRGQVILYPNGLKTQNAAAEAKTILNIDAEVQWAGLHSVAFDPDWPAQPFMYILYTGYTNINQAAGERYPNNLNQYRPGNWDKQQCGNIGDGANYNYCYKTRIDCPDLNACPAIHFYCELMAHVDRVRLNPTTMDLISRTGIYKGGCSGYWGHMFGNVMFDAKKHMLIMTGDKAIDWVSVEPGCEGHDMCYDTAAGAPQGQWNAIREHSDSGKLMRVDDPVRYRTATGFMTKGTDYYNIARGLRNPYTAWLDPLDDYVWITDTGDASAERIHRLPTNLPRGTVQNMGWPCIDGNFPLNDIDNGVVIQTNGERTRATFLKQQGLTTCDATYKAAGKDAVNYIVGNAATTVADPGYRLSDFEYRNKPDKTIDGCAALGAAITGAIRNYGTKIGSYYTNGLFFSDHSKECLFFIPSLPDGTLDVANPRAVLAGITISWMRMHPDGSLLLMYYFDEFVDQKIVKIYGSTMTGGPVLPAPGTPAIPAPPAGTAVVTNLGATGTCQPTLKPFVWTDDGAGYLTGTLKIGALQYSNKYGETRARGYNGGIPGPTITMEACKKYKLTLINDMSGWPNAPGAGVNGAHSPSSTNLHTHGLHISGEGFADNVFNTVESGASFTHIYAIPCDHPGGTYWYHAHKHGSVNLQVAGGAAGLLIIKDNPTYEVPQQTTSFKNMPVKEFVLARVTPAETRGTAFDSSDELYKSTAQDNHWLLNGCVYGATTINANQWTRLRFVYVGGQSSGVLTFKPDPAAGGATCKARLIAKDGVYLSTVPRLLDEPKLLFAFGSRVDVAIFCNVGTYNMDMVLVNDVDQNTMATAGPTVGALIAVNDPAYQQPFAEMTPWVPCRPFYLLDLTKEDAANSGGSLSINFNEGTINGVAFAGDASTPIATIQEGQWYQWSYGNTENHPGHMHVNHVQIVNFSPRPQVSPQFHQVGDWLDVVSFPGTSTAFRFRADRYGGRAVIHCHVSVHADSGMAAIVQIAGGSATNSEETAIITKPVCTSPLPVLEAAVGEFAVPTLATGRAAYTVVDTLADLRDVKAGPEGIGYINAGSSIVYTLNVATAGTYNVVYTMNSFNGAPAGINVSMSIHKGRVVCPATIGAEGAALIPNFPIPSLKYRATDITLAAGISQEYTLCFQSGMWINFANMCIAPTGVCPVATEARPAGGIIVDPIVPITPPVTPPLTGQMTVPTAAAGGAAITVVNGVTDYRDVKAGADGIGYINAGSSIVYTLNVATAGTYNVVYTMNSFNGAPAGINVSMSLHKGRITCPATIGAAGAAVIPNFPVPSYKYRATDVTLAAGAGQEYTLCFQAGMWINFANMCIAPTGVCTVTAEARPAGGIIVDPVVSPVTPPVTPVTPPVVPIVPPATPVVPMVGQVPVPTIAAGGAANTVVNALTDLRDLKPGGDGTGLGYINAGSSVVYTLNVATAGTYNVVYSLSGVNGSPAGINVSMSLHKGRVVCPAAIGAAGAAVIPNFPVPAYKYRATDITLAAGVGQEYTLCFQSGSWMNYASMCIAPTGVCTVTAEARPAGAIVVDPVVPITPPVTPVTPPLTPVVPITGQVSVPSVAAGAATNTVVNGGTDLRNLKPSGDGTGLGYINAGSSIVYTLNVATAGTYNVVYTMNGVNGSPAGITVSMSLHKGRIVCPGAIGTAGAAVIPNFPVPSYKYRATDVTLAAGAGQEYTLCFQAGGWMDFTKICIAPTGVCTVTAEARPAGAITTGRRAEEVQVDAEGNIEVTSTTTNFDDSENDKDANADTDSITNPKRLRGVA